MEVDLNSDQRSELDRFKNFVEVVFWAALTAAGGWLTIPLPGVPITFQTLFVLACGLHQGPKRATAAIGLYLAAGLMGLPVFAGGLAGPAVLKAPSAGFLLAFPLAAAISGLGRPAGEAPGWLRGLGSGLLATVVIYAGGVLGLRINAGLSWPSALAALVLFWPGDFLKAVLAVALVRLLAGRPPAGIKGRLND